jgi:DNA topoisomerase-1
MAARAKTPAGADGTTAADALGDDARRLVIVESPAKAKTIAGYLGRNYVVESSIGHIRDLPTSAADIPAKYKKEAWARLGVDVDHGFEPLYVVNADKRQQVAKLKAALADADELYLATDEDREGEAIAWHLLEVLNPKVPVKRMVFHEITRDAIREAAGNTRELNTALVDAQETRRILDRLYGYEVSPVLWKKVMPRLSAGRVQSVATRMVVERERERIAFRSASYWDVDARFAATDPAFEATLVTLDGARVAVGRDFDSVGRLKSTELVHLDEATATQLTNDLTGVEFVVRSVESKPYRRSPAAPFMTSTLQQEASRKLRYSSQTTMRIAQRLYENGHITYMRTDSTTLSETALNAARSQVRELYGAAYVPDVPRRYEKKVKNAQEAHEAIRPSGDSFRTPGELAGQLSSDEARLYELIWQRTVASQMNDATGQTVTMRLGATSRGGRDAEFSSSGTVITFPGFLKVYVEGADDESSEENSRERRLPALAEGDTVLATELEAVGHSTNPPARYTEASLVRALEERGIGRPSTFATIMTTILDRGYVFKKGSALVPTFIAFAVVQLLERHFGDLVDYDFTAEMEEDLDRIADGETVGTAWLSHFYFGTPMDGGDGAAVGAALKDDGGPGPGLKAMVSDRLGEIDARDISSFPLGDSGIVVRVGRYGTYLERDGQRANVGDGVAPDELTVEYATELLDMPSGDRPLGAEPVSGLPIVAKSGRYGPYVTEVLPEGSKTKPRTASLFQTMSLDTVTLDDALQLLTLPRVLGESDGEEVVASNGRYGPYVKKGAETRSIESEPQLLTITLPEALEVLAQPKQRGRRAAAAGPLRELGVDLTSAKPVVVRDGRFGPYVTDGETNATLRKGDDVESITLERAVELLADKRARGPAPKKTARKAPARKTAAKKTAVKKAVAKKTVAKKSTVKKTAAKTAAKKVAASVARG